MSQIPINIVATDHLDGSITIALRGGKRIEYVLGSQYSYMLKATQTWMINGWHNFVVSKLTEAAHEIYINGRKATKEEIKTMVEFRKTPSEEFSFTVIATTAKSLTYQNDRKWFQSKEDATTFAGEVFELERNQKTSFELAIVQCVDVVKPKPQVEMVSTFKKTTTESSE